MFRTLLEEFVIPVLLFLVVRSMLRGWFAQSRRTPAPRDRAADIPHATELKKDPVCGTYVSAGTGITRVIHGEVICFCSDECRTRFDHLKQNQPPS